MDKNTVILITVGGAAVLAVGAVAFLKFAAKKGWPVAGFISKAKKGVEIAKETVEELKPFLPVPVSSVAELALKLSETGVAEAAQLCKVGTVSKDQRKAEATKFVESAFAVEGITVTPAIAALIDKAIEGAVWVMDHSDAAAPDANSAVYVAKTDLTISEQADAARAGAEKIVSQQTATVTDA